MVTVKVYGTLRLDSGVKELRLDVDSVPELTRQVYAEALRLKPDSGVSMKDIRSCMVVVNGKMVRPNAKLNDGDEIMLVPASGGG